MFRGVDHGIGPHGLRSCPVLIANFERSRFAAFCLELIQADAADIGDARRYMHHVLQRRSGRKRFEIALDEFGAGRIDRRNRGNSIRWPTAAARLPCRYCIPREKKAGHAPIAAQRARSGVPPPAGQGSGPAPAHCGGRKAHGPTPIIATVFACDICFSHGLDYRSSAPEKIRRRSSYLPGFGVRAALGDKKIDKTTHDMVIRVANERCRLAHLREPHRHERLYVVRKRASGAIFSFPASALPGNQPLPRERERDKYLRRVGFPRASSRAATSSIFMRKSFLQNGNRVNHLSSIIEIEGSFP